MINGAWTLGLAVAIPPRSRQSGFSLIEMMISIIILAVGMMAVMSMQTATLRSNLNNQNLLSAQQVGQHAVEWVRTLTDKELTSSAVLFPAVGVDAYADLSTDFQFSGLSTALGSFPSGIGTPDFTKIVPHRVRFVQDPDRDHIDRLFVIRVAVERDYRATLSRCAATVYWEQDGELLSMDIIFFVEKKV